MSSASANDVRFAPYDESVMAMCVPSAYKPAHATPTDASFANPRRKPKMETESDVILGLWPSKRQALTLNS